MRTAVCLYLYSCDTQTVYSQEQNFKFYESGVLPHVTSGGFATSSYIQHNIHIAFPLSIRFKPTEDPKTERIHFKNK